MRTRYNAGGRSNQQEFDRMSNVITPLQVRDSSLGTANRIEIYQLHGVLPKCAVFSSQWAIELIAGKEVFYGRGSSRKKALEMAEQAWRIHDDNLKRNQDGTYNKRKNSEVPEDRVV